MERQNVTLSLPKETLRKAKILATQRQTSLSGMLTAVIEEIVAHSDLYEVAKERQIALMERGIPFNSEQAESWTRDDLHER